MKLTASEVQEMIAAKDGEIVAHGYTLERETLDVWFAHGEIVRRRTKGEFVDLSSSAEFDPEFFFASVKRWYTGTSERGLNVRLAALFETFGRPLWTTEGGKYPVSLV